MATLPESALGWAVGLFVLGGAVGGIGFAWQAHVRGQVEEDVRRVAEAVQGLHGEAVEYTGLDEGVVIASGVLPPRMVRGTGLWAGRGGGSVEIFVAPGGTGPGAGDLGAGDAFYFLLGVGGGVGAVADVDACVTLVMVAWEGLQGVQVRARAAGVAAAVAVDPGLGIAGGTYSVMAGPLSVFAGLEERRPDAVQALCEGVIAASGGAQVVYALR